MFWSKRDAPMSVPIDKKKTIKKTNPQKAKLTKKPSPTPPNPAMSEAFVRGGVGKILEREEDATVMSKQPQDHIVPEKLQPPAMTPDQQIEKAKARVTAAESQLRGAVSEASRAKNYLHNLLVQHGKIATKKPRQGKSPKLGQSIPKPTRTTEAIPSLVETGPMKGMTKKPPPIDKAIREAEEALNSILSRRGRKLGNKKAGK